ELNVTPSAVSQQIKKLESYLGVELFLRSSNTLQLTEQGESMVQSVREGLECFVTGVESTRRVHPLSLNVSAPPSFATNWLVRHVAGFSAVHPNIALRITSSTLNIDSPEALANIAGKSIDPLWNDGEVAIRFGVGEYPGYWVEKLFMPEYVLVCSPSLMESDTPLRSLRDLRKQVFIHNETITDVSKRPSWHEWMKLAKVRGVDTENGPRYSNSVLVHEAVLEGQGIALVVKKFIEADVAAGRLVIPFSIALPSAYAYYIVIPRKDVSKAEVQAFRKWISLEIGRKSPV
ncbi:MAG: LysR family transcriptional regulator, partial [Deltaproteobacteria bacterium]|nr:LysR family transcriptional regulator [Deltaproteobacteria bacterium]